MEYKIISNEELFRLHNLGKGFIFNYFTDGKTAYKYNVLHSADCNWVTKSNTNVKKYFFRTIKDAEEGLLREIGNQDERWKKCGTCSAIGKSFLEDIEKIINKEIKVENNKENVNIFQEPKVQKLLNNYSKQGVCNKNATNINVVTNNDEKIQFIEGRSMNYSLNYSEDKIELWSSARLQFEPKGWMREMRDALKYHLEHTLTRDNNNYLHAVYSSERDKNTSFDIENILFYNIGVDSFKNLAKRGVVFERKIKSPDVLKINSESFKFDHYMKYKVLDSIIDGSKYWEKDRPLASWSDAKIESLKTTLTLSSIWIQMNKCKINLYNRHVNQDPLGININLKVPARYLGFNFVTILKSLLDGIISSFHTHNGKNIGEIVARLSNKNRMNPEAVKQLLLKTGKDVLGQKDLIWLWGDSVQWNPSDDLIYYGEIKIDYSNKISITEFDGELFSIKAKFLF